MIITDVNILHLATVIGMIICIIAATSRKATRFDKAFFSVSLGLYILVFIALFFAY